MVGGCREVTWQRWQRNGCFVFSIRSLFEPCESWQLVQPSTTAACSNRYGPRFSAWHVVHASLTVVPTLSSFTLVVPCGLWHDEHSILPSFTGMCADLRTLFTWLRWHWT